jgi:hypothetical protein
MPIQKLKCMENLDRKSTISWLCIFNMFSWTRHCHILSCHAYIAIATWCNCGCGIHWSCLLNSMTISFEKWCPQTGTCQWYKARIKGQGPWSLPVGDLEVLIKLENLRKVYNCPVIIICQNTQIITQIPFISPFIPVVIQITLFSLDYNYFHSYTLNLKHP